MKRQFPRLQEPLIYFDSAATTQKPQVVIDAMSNFLSKEYATVHRAVYSPAEKATARYNDARSAVARFINAEPDEIVFTRGTTEAINLIAHVFPFKAGDEIILSELEHHSNIVPWQLLRDRTGVVLKFIPALDSGDLDLAAFRALLSPRTKLVSLAWIANSIGTRHPIEQIIEEAHRAGAKVFVDAAQAAAHLPIDVRALDCDFLAFSSHKMYGPTGIGILYGKDLGSLPPWHGGGDMIEKVTLEKTTYNRPPLRFEAGTPMITEAIGLHAAVNFLTPLLSESPLTEVALEQLRRINEVQIIGTPQQRGPIIAFTVKGVHPLDIASWLDLKGVCLRSGHMCAQPALARFGLESMLRISFGVYNTLDEVDRFAALLREAIAKPNLAVGA